MFEFTQQSMLQLVVFIFSIGIQGLVTSHEQEQSFDPQQNLVLPKESPTDKPRTCTSKEVQRFSDTYHNCFIHKKYEGGDKDPDILVDRILEHSRVCVENSTLECRPNLKGFITMMEKVIHQIRDYNYIYLEHISRERYKIQDLKCVEGSFSKKIYQSCFTEILGEGTYSSEKKFQQKVENSTSCMNKSHKLCSMAAKTSLNRMARTILRVEQPQKERTEDALKLELPVNWYDYITRPNVDHAEKESTKTELKTEPPKKWYDYITPPKVEHTEKEDTKDELKTEPSKMRYDYTTPPKVEQPEKKDVEDELKPEPPNTRYKYIAPRRIEKPVRENAYKVNEPQRDPQPQPQKKWYHYITEPFVKVWNAIKSLFTC